MVLRVCVCVCVGGWVSGGYIDIRKTGKRKRKFIICNKVLMQICNSLIAN